MIDTTRRFHDQSGFIVGGGGMGLPGWLVGSGDGY